jgi:hypothetical protein
MKTLLNRLATWLWDKTTPGPLTIDDLTYALQQAEHWREQWVQSKAEAVTHRQALIEELHAVKTTLARLQDAAKPTRQKPEKPEKAAKERRSRRSGPIKD